MAPAAERIGLVGMEAVRIAVDVEEHLLQHVVRIDVMEGAAQIALDRVQERGAVEFEQQREHRRLARILEAVHQAGADPVQVVLVGGHHHSVARRAAGSQLEQRPVAGQLPECEQPRGQRFAIEMWAGVQHGKTGGGPHTNRRTPVILP